MRRLDEILKEMTSVDSPSPGDTGISSVAEGIEEGVCPLCRGAGFVRRDVPLDHPDFGRAFPCRCVLEEHEEERLARLQRYSNLGPLTRLTFVNLMSRGRSTDTRNQERFAKAVAAAQEFAQEPDGWLVLCGPSGCGKTHLAAAIANDCLQRGLAAFFVVVPDLLDHLRAAYRPGSEVPYDELFEQVRNAPLVILDDLGSQTFTPWAQEKLFQLLNHRYNYRLPTVFTTSVSLDEMDERLRTRLCDAGISRILTLEETCGRREASGGLSLALIRNMTFESFNLKSVGVTEEGTQSRRNAFRLAREYAESPEGWLVFLGRTGCGKTHLAAAIGHYLQARGMPVEFRVVPDLLDDLREDAAGGRFDEVFEAVRTVPCLILDDLGVHSATPWAQEKLFQILNYRYNAKLPTVITIGCPLDQLPEAWVSRMYDPEVAKIFEIEAPDYRGLPRRQGQTLPAQPRRPGRPKTPRPR